MLCRGDWIGEFLDELAAFPHGAWEEWLPTRRASVHRTHGEVIADRAEVDRAALLPLPVPIVEAFYDAFNRGDFDAACECVADDVENSDPTGTIRGWDAFRQFIETFKTASPDVKLIANRWIEEGDLVAAEGTFTGTFTGPLRSPAGELPPTGQPFELPYAEFNEIEGGRIKLHRVYGRLAAPPPTSPAPHTPGWP